jgi:hypothetical protein
MKHLSPYTARRRKGRVASQLKHRLDRLMRRLPECQWVLAYRFLGETRNTAGHEWHAIASHDGLVSKTMASTSSLDEALLKPSEQGEIEKPRNSVARARECRHLLREAWLRHVHGTPFQGRVQMYRMVRDGECDGFPWWNDVVGQGVPFTNDAVNTPDVSSRLWDYLVGELAEKK